MLPKSCLFAMAMFLLCSRSIAANDIVEKIRQTHTIRFSYIDDQYPFSYTLMEKPVGMAIDLCRKVASNIEHDLGVKPLHIQWIKTTSAARFQMVLNHEADIVCSNLTDTPSRRTKLLFSDPFFYSSTAYIFHKKSHLEKKELLSGHTVYVTSGGVAMPELIRLNAHLHYSFLIHLSQTPDSGFNNMKNNENSVFVADDILLYSLMLKYTPPGEYEISNDRLNNDQPFALASAKDSIYLQKKTNETLHDLFDSGEFEIIYKKWFLTPIPPENILLNIPLSTTLRNDISRIQHTSSGK